MCKVRHYSLSCYITHKCCFKSVEISWATRGVTGYKKEKK